MNKVVLYCRPGFEKECAAEITDKAARLEVFGIARVKEDSGYVIFEGYQQDDGEKLVRDLGGAVHHERRGEWTCFVVRLAMASEAA